MRGYFGIGIENSKREVNVGTLWRSAYCLGAAFIFTIGQRYTHQSSDTTKASRHIPLYEYGDIDYFVAHKPVGCDLIGIEIAEDSVPIKTFIHPERAIYILGPEDGSLSSRTKSLCKAIIDIESRYCLNVAVAGSIVMYDRQTKQ